MRTIEAVKLTIAQSYASVTIDPSQFNNAVPVLLSFFFFINDNRYRIEDKVLVLLDQVLPKKMRLQQFLETVGPVKILGWAS